MSPTSDEMNDASQMNFNIFHDQNLILLDSFEDNFLGCLQPKKKRNN